MDATADPVQLVGTLMSGFVDSRCVHVVANLGVADVVGEEPMPIARLAGELGVDAGSLTRLLRHLVTLGLFSIHGNGVAHNEASRLLRSDHQQGMLPLAQIWPCRSFGTRLGIRRTLFARAVRERPSLTSADSSVIWPIIPTSQQSTTGG